MDYWSLQLPEWVLSHGSEEQLVTQRRRSLLSQARALLAFLRRGRECHSCYERSCTALGTAPAWRRRDTRPQHRLHCLYALLRLGESTKSCAQGDEFGSIHDSPNEPVQFIKCCSTRRCTYAQTMPLVAASNILGVIFEPTKSSNKCIFRIGSLCHCRL